MTQTPPPKPSVALSVRIEKSLRSSLDSLDVIGKNVMGDLWLTFYLSVQDAIALACISKIPNLVSNFIIGKEFSSFRACVLEDALSANRYSCFIIVIADFLIWIVLGTRIFIRFIQDIRGLLRKGRGKNGQNP